MLRDANKAKEERHLMFSLVQWLNMIFFLLLVHNYMVLCEILIERMMRWLWEFWAELGFCYWKKRIRNFIESREFFEKSAQPAKRSVRQMQIVRLGHKNKHFFKWPKKKSDKIFLRHSHNQKKAHKNFFNQIKSSFLSYLSCEILISCFFLLQTKPQNKENRIWANKKKWFSARQFMNINNRKCPCHNHTHKNRRP